MDSTDTILYSFKECIRIIDIAFGCVFINTSEKEKILKVLDEKSKEQSDIDLVDILKQDDVISDKRIEYLLAFDKHLQILYQDEQFGRIAVANGMATKEDVANALEYQKNYFKNNRMNIKIGDVLVGNGCIKPGHRASILLTQNRIKNENLSDTLNDLSVTETEKEIASKLFSALAIKKQKVTIEQVNVALDIQKKERATQDEPRSIGQILKETADLSDKDILDILLEQKQFEKRRLDLEKALYTAKSEIKISKKFNRLFEYSISRNGLEAFVTKQTEIDEKLSVYEFLIWLRRVGIKFGIVDDSVLEEFIHTAEKKSQITVAKGHPPRQCINESIQVYFKNDFFPEQLTVKKTDSEQEQKEPLEGTDTAQEKKLEKEQPQGEGVEEEKVSEEDGDGTEDQDTEDQDTEEKPDDAIAEKKEDIDDNKPVKEEKTPHTSGSEQEDIVEKESDEPFLVKKGNLMAQIVPGKKGKPGKDVLGYPIQPDKPVISVLNAGSGVIKKGSSYFAMTGGFPVLKNGTTLMVEPVVKKIKVKTVTGTIENDTEDLYESTTVELSGTVTAAATLRCHSLVLHGDLKGCVICAGDIDVKGGIGTDEKPKDKEEAVFQADITCQGSIKVSKSIINSKIQTEGELLALNSTIIGSEVIAFKGVTIRDSLKGENTPSILRFGIKPGDKILALDNTLDTKNAELSILKKQEEITELTLQYKRDLEEEENHLMEQAILKNLIEIIEGPELFQHETLEDKIKYLKGLPDFSSIKIDYLKLPETDAALSFLRQIITSTQEDSLENALKYIKPKIDPEQEVENVGSNISYIESEFKSSLAELEQEVADSSEEIGKIENEISALKALRVKLLSIHVNSLTQSRAAVKIKNKCEMGTIIKGKIARLVLEKTLYNVKFKEIVNPKTKTVSIAIETY